MRQWTFFCIGLILLSGLFLTAEPLRAQRAAGEVAPEQLPPGKVEGAFTFRYTAQIKFTQEAVFPVHIMLFTDQQVPVTDLTVPDASAFTIAADLPPGGYQIRSEVLSSKESGYWGADGPSFFITSTGMARYFLPANCLIHVKKLQVLTENPQHLSAASRAGMTLRWEAMRSAVRYHIAWTEQTLPKHEKVANGADDVTSEEYTFTGDVHVNRRYELFIHAFDSNGRLMGSSAPFYFYTAGSQKVSEPKVAAKSDRKRESDSESESIAGPEKPKEKTAETKPTPKGAPYFGIRPRPVPAQGEQRPGGIRVDDLGVDSPAAKAGLRREDVITNFNGVPLSGETTVDQFTGLIRQVPLGARVPIEFYRKNERMTLEVTIEARR